MAQFQEGGKLNCKPLNPKPERQNVLVSRFTFDGKIN